MKPASKFIRFFSVLFALIVIILLIGRNHFIFGTGLILTRWFWVILGAILILVLYSKTPKNYYKIIVISVFLLLFEYIWVSLNFQNPDYEKANKEISILSYNLFFKNKYKQSSLIIVKNAKADILLIQELTPSWYNILNNSISKFYPYKKVIPLKGTHGIGIYSKYKILKNNIIYNTSKLPVAVISEIQVEGKKVQVINTHLASPARAVEMPKEFLKHYNLSYSQRKIQINEIKEIINKRKKESSAFILSGDLNTMRFEPLFRNLKMNWVNLFEEVGHGLGFNFPNTNKIKPVLTLDYILIKGNVKPVSFKVIKGGGSDHLAILGKIKI